MVNCLITVSEQISFTDCLKFVMDFIITMYLFREKSTGRKTPSIDNLSPNFKVLFSLFFVSPCHIIYYMFYSFSFTLIKFPVVSLFQVSWHLVKIEVEILLFDWTSNLGNITTSTQTQWHVGKENVRPSNRDIPVSYYPFLILKNQYSLIFFVYTFCLFFIFLHNIYLSFLFYEEHKEI